MKRRSFLRFLGISGAIAPLTPVLWWVSTRAAPVLGELRGPVLKYVAPHYHAYWTIGTINYGVGCVDKGRLLRGLPIHIAGSQIAYEEHWHKNDPLYAA